MREDDCGVEDNPMDDIESSQIILKSMADKYGVGIDEPHQIILNFLKILCLAGNYKKKQVINGAT